MDLWIKTQNEGLHQIIGINAPYVQKDCTSLVGYSNYKHIELGVYKTEERALEVLDEITNLIKPKYLIRIDNHESINDFLNNKNNSYVSAESFGMVSNINQTLYYEMPKE